MILIYQSSNLKPGVLQNEYMISGSGGSGGVWPFYSDSTNITISKPVFFQRAKLVESAGAGASGETNTGDELSTEEKAIIRYNATPATSNYKYRPMVLVTDLDEIYELGQTAGEIVGTTIFETVGIIQHTVDPYIGYKFVGGGDNSVSPAIVQNVISRRCDSIILGVIYWIYSISQNLTPNNYIRYDGVCVVC